MNDVPLRCIPVTHTALDCGLTSAADEPACGVIDGCPLLRREPRPPSGQVAPTGPASCFPPAGRTDEEVQDQADDRDQEDRRERILLSVDVEQRRRCEVPGHSGNTVPRAHDDTPTHV